MEPNQVQQPIATGPVEKKSLGPIVGIVVVVILLVLGALYVWGGKISENAVEETPAATTSDEISAIESDLGASGEIEIDLSGLE